SRAAGCRLGVRIDVFSPIHRSGYVWSDLGPDLDAILLPKLNAAIADVRRSKARALTGQASVQASKCDSSTGAPPALVIARFLRRWCGRPCTPVEHRTAISGGCRTAEYPRAKSGIGSDCKILAWPT